MSPLEFMQRLAALVPRPRLHLIRFHGALAPNAKLRAAIVPIPSGLKQLVINLDNEPECNGHRSQFLLRMTEFADRTGLCVRLVYYPPYHSKYNAIERYWAGEVMEWIFAQYCRYGVKSSWEFLLEGVAHCGAVAGCPLRERNEGL